LPKLKDLRRETADEAWECPPVSKISERKKRRDVVMLHTIQ
jgi:hypothetical protein